MVPFTFRSFLCPVVLQAMLIVNAQRILCTTESEADMSNADFSTTHPPTTPSSNNWTQDNDNMYKISNPSNYSDPQTENELKKLNECGDIDDEAIIQLHESVSDFIGRYNERLEQGVKNITEKVNVNLDKYKYNCSLQGIVEKCFTYRSHTQKNYLCVVFNMVNLILQYRYNEIQKLNNSINDISNSSTLCKYSDINSILKERQYVKGLIVYFLHNATYFKRFTNLEESKGIYKSVLNNPQIDLRQWGNSLRKWIDEIRDLNVTYDRLIKDDKFLSIIQDYIQPVVQCVIFAFGFLGNALLLNIFARHKEVRTSGNLMLMNLVFVDSLNLIVYICQIYLSFSSDTNDGLCIAFQVLTQLCICVSVYSVVVISFERFLRIRESCKQLFWSKYRVLKSFKYFSVVFVWIISALFAILYMYVLLYKHNHEKHLYYKRIFSIVNFFAICLVPLILITILSILSAKKLKESVRHMREIRPEMDSVIKSRIIGSRLILILTAVFAFSYIPFYLFSLLQYSVEIEIRRTLTFIIVFVTYSLVFCNACFNPIALYIGSQKFRYYFQKYIPCKKRK